MSDAATFTDTLKLLAAKGLRYGTVVDIGCADGHFFLQHLGLGVLAGASPVNVDANPIYEGSLKAIKDTIGGHYVIAAAAERAGEVELTLGVHPYWSSLLNATEDYWQRMNQLHQGKTKVRAVTVDSLTRDLGLSPPFLLKLDVQGGELAALKGASDTLKETDVVICELDAVDFHALDQVLNESGLALFDVTDLRRMADRSLGWFYAVYLNRRQDAAARSRSLWDRSLDQSVIDHQRQRRDSVLEFNARALAELRKRR